MPPSHDGPPRPGDADDLRARVLAEVDRRADLLADVSHRIWERPELCFEEHHAHDLLAGALEDAGLAVERHAHGLDTAFVARAGEADGPTVAVCCEYDALPGIGHACGHNVIAAAGLGAGIAAATVAAEAGGRVLVLGTPAEEGGGGKVLLAERGAFDGVDAALMVHPADRELARMTTIAVARVHVTYHGRAAHAAAAPEQGVNALDAAVLGYMNVAALRQHIRPDERIHGIFTEAGTAPNIVPARAAAIWYVRSPQLATLQPLKARVVAALTAGAAATGAEMTHEWVTGDYAELVDAAPLVERWVANLAGLGREVGEPGAGAEVVGSTDMGNVSHLVPAIHPMIGVAPPGVPIHSPEFAEHARSEAGDRAAVDGAKGLALCIVDLWTDPDLQRRTRDAFAARVHQPDAGRT